MGGKSAYKSSQHKQATELLTDGARLGKNMDTATARSSTYPGVLELLLKSNYAKIISMAEIDEIARNLYGRNWIKVVNNWKQLPEQNVLQQQELEAANV